ncbi:MAG: TrkA family potassium uptake protein [Leptospiraceae bacterium]|nr:TrkA family potassium uptake protein [Leptospiraceae bacterium]
MRKKIAVIGLGDFGKALVKHLHEEGHEVTAIDHDLPTIESIKSRCTHAVCLNSTDERALRSQGVEQMDTVIISAAQSFETLIVTADIMRRIFNGQLIVRYRTALHKRILEMLGVKELFNPEERAAENMAEQFAHPSIRRSMFLEEGFRLFEVEAPPALVGMSLNGASLKKRFNISIVTIRRARDPERPKDHLEFIGIPDGKTIIRADDVLVLFGKESNLEDFIDELM